MEFNFFPPEFSFNNGLFACLPEELNRGNGMLPNVFFGFPYLSKKGRRQSTGVGDCMGSVSMTCTAS